MVGCHHELNADEFEQTLGDGEGQGRLVCCSPCGRKEWDMTERLNTTTVYRLAGSLSRRVAFELNNKRDGHGKF